MFLFLMTAAASLWTPLLTVLNQEPQPAKPPLVAPFSHGLEQDLRALNVQEMRAIQEAWKVSAGSAVRDRVRTNEFFHRDVQKLNAQTFAAIEKAAASHATTKKDYTAIATQVLAKVSQNPVAKLESSMGYDQSGQVGFCFGRALLVHLHLLEAGVPQDDLAKIFNVGQLMVGDQLWSFHVATMVRDAKAGYIVVDPLQAKPLPYKEWVEINARYEIKKTLSRARFYVTDPRKFLPSFGRYDLKQLEEPVLKTYFTDLARTLTRS